MFKNSFKVRVFTALSSKNTNQV